MFRLLSLFVLVASLVVPTLAKSQIALFSDNNCKDSLRGLEGPNGYPNGTCTDFRHTGPYGSFHVVGLDTGCTVTIYTTDPSGDICASTAYQQEIGLIDCYNSTFVYYSIDFCDGGAARARPSDTSSSSNTSPKSKTGAIVGGVVGGVVVITILVCAVLFCVVRRRRTRGGEQTVQEVDGSERVQVQELQTGYEKYEFAAVEPVRPPVELEGGETRRERIGVAY